VGTDRVAARSLLPADVGEAHTGFEPVFLLDALAESVRLYQTEFDGENDVVLDISHDSIGGRNV
jgi:hypothetical protein